MAVFTFVVRKSDGTWTATQHGGEHNLKESASSTFELERKLVNLALQTAGSNSVTSSFNIITPTSAVAQVILGGGGGGGFAASGGGVPASAAGASAEVPVEEEKKEEEEEESDGDIGFSLFDD